jgi:hypothetical protein
MFTIKPQLFRVLVADDDPVIRHLVASSVCGIPCCCSGAGIIIAATESNRPMNRAELGHLQCDD